MPATITLEFTGNFKKYRVEYVEPGTGDYTKVRFNKKNIGVVPLKGTKKEHRFIVRVTGKNSAKFGIKFSKNVKTPSRPVSKEITRDNLYTSVQYVTIK